MSCQNITSECAPVEVESVVMLGIVEKEVEEIFIENGRPKNSGA